MRAKSLADADAIFMNSTFVSADKEPVHEPAPEPVLVAPKATAVAPTDVPHAAAPVLPRPAISPAPVRQADNVITIDDKKIAVEVWFETSKGSKFAVEFKAASVEESDESISILYRSEFQIQFPIMEELKVRTRGTTHTVLFVGGRHKLGTFTNISFVKYNPDQINDRETSGN